MARRVRDSVVRASWLLPSFGLLIVICAVLAYSHAHSASSDNPYPTLPPEKQQAIDADANARAAALANPPSPGARKPDGPQQTNPAIPLGIFAAADFPPQMNGFVFQTVWIGAGADRGYMKVYTGAIPSEGGRGVVMAFNTDVNRKLNSSTLALYPAPFGVGSLRILSANGNLLSLQVATGETFYFDAQTRKLSDANGNPASTDTPTPTPFPEPTPGGTLPFPFPFPTDTAPAVPSPAASSASIP